MTTSTTIKIDSTLKMEAQELFDELGLTLSTAVNLFLRQAVREQAIPFRIGQLVPNQETLQALEDSRNGVELSRPFHSVAELMEDLNADDSISDQL